MPRAWHILVVYNFCYYFSQITRKPACPVAHVHGESKPTLSPTPASQRPAKGEAAYSPLCHFKAIYGGCICPDAGKVRRKGRRREQRSPASRPPSRAPGPPCSPSLGTSKPDSKRPDPKTA